MNRKFIKAKDFIASYNKRMPRTLYLEWKEGDISVVHGKREAGLSIVAMGISNCVAKSGTEVLYVNADRRFGRIASSDEASDNVYVYTPEYESPDDERDYADLVFDCLEEAVKTTNIRTIVVDSVMRIAALSFGRNASAAYIMKRLAALSMRHKLSLLVVADDANRAALRAILSYADVGFTVNPPAESAPDAATKPVANQSQSVASDGQFAVPECSKVAKAAGHSGILKKGTPIPYKR